MKYCNILRSLNKNAFIDLKQEFLRHARQLFNVAACKCSSGTDCVFDIPSKVQSLEREFLEDQRRDMKMIIGAIDVQGTNKRKRRLCRLEERKRTPECSTLSCHNTSVWEDSGNEIIVNEE